MPKHSFININFRNTIMEIAINISSCEGNISLRKLSTKDSYNAPSTISTNDYESETMNDICFGLQNELILQIVSTINPNLLYFSENLDHLKKQECKLWSPIEILNGHSATANFRARMIDWFIEVTKAMEFNLYTLFKTVAIIDRYLQLTSNHYTDYDIQRIGVTALLMATKLEYTGKLNIPTIHNQLTNGTIGIREISNLEIEIMNTLKFSICIPTDLEFIDIFAEVLDEGFGDIISHAKYIAILNLYSVEIVNIKPSVRAAANLSIAIKEAIISPEECVMEKLVYLTGADEEEIEKSVLRIEEHKQLFKQLYPDLKNGINFIPY